MSEKLANGLARLAPAVDEPASRELFDRGRSADRSGGGRVWLAAAAALVLIAGVVGVWALARDDDGTVPLEPPSTTAASSIAGPATEGNGYDTLLVAETNAGFGNAVLATDNESYQSAWTDFLVDGEPPAVDFGRSVALLMARPDNACPDTIVEFTNEGGDPPTWTPALVDLSEGCVQPLLSMFYVVAIDRALLGPAATIRIPAAEVYDVNEVLLTYVADRDPTDDVAEPATVVLEPTGVTVPLPAVGSPEFHSTPIGFVWAVAHEDGTFSVLPGTVDAPVNEDLGPVGPMASLVRVSSSGRTFSAGVRLVWDDRGRAVSGGRSDDLSRLAGRVVDTDAGPVIEILTSTAPRVDGAPTPRPEGEEYPLPPLVEPIDLDTWMTLSSSGPIWRHLDATLVVEDGVGRICDVQPDPVPDLATCADAEDDGGLVLDTQVRADDPDITTWFHAPILAFQDPVRGFTTIVPLGGQSSRNEAAESESQEAVEDAAEGDGWRLLASGRIAVDRPRLPWLAVEQRQYDELMSELGLVAEGAPIDWDSELVVTFSEFHNSCVPRLLRVFLAESGRWRAAYTTPRGDDGMCNDIGLTSAWVVALDRAATGTTISMDVPGDFLGRGTTSVDFDISDGSVTEGGLAFHEPVGVSCLQGGGIAVTVALASVLDEEARIDLEHDAGGVSNVVANLERRQTLYVDIPIPDRLLEGTVRVTATPNDRPGLTSTSAQASDLLSSAAECP